MAPYRKYDMMAQLDTEKAKKQARLNKQRADRMERDVAAYLNRGRLLISRRTPQSGAGWIKGDNHVPLPSAPDFFLISCKMSQAQDENSQAYINFSYKWILELNKDVNAMRSIGCKFGIIVLRWFGRSKGELVAFVPVTNTEVIKSIVNLDIKYDNLNKIEFKKKNGEFVKVAKVYRHVVLENLYKVFVIDGIEFVAVHLSTIHQALIDYDMVYNDSSGEV
jgi:hypothetical protein